MVLERLAPKSIQKKRNDNKQQGLENIVLRKKITKRFLSNKKHKIIRAESYMNSYKKKNDLLVKEKYLAKKEGKFFVPSQAKVFFVIRIKGINGVPPNIKKILQLIRLRQVNSGIFLKVNSSTIQMLKKIEPFVAYGYPSLKTIKKLLSHKGYGKIGKRGDWQRISLSDDRVIEQALVNIGVLSLDDMINEIFTCGARFKEVNNFLWPFRLKSPQKGFSKVGKNKHVSEKGTYGNWENEIDELILKMA